MAWMLDKVAPDFELLEPKTNEKVKLTDYAKGASATLVM